MSVVAVIPARGGSKGVPRKNVRPVGGVPLIVRAIEAALAASRIDRVIVSTDDSEIASLSTAAGAEIVLRPLDLSGDTASSESAVLHALESVADVETVVFIQATSPFISAGDLDRGVAEVEDGGCDVAFSAFESYGFLWRRDANAGAEAINHDATHRPRRQDRDPHYMETGAFYVMDAAGFRAARHRFFGRIGIVEVAESTAIEIDDVHQLALAGAIAHLVAPPQPLQVDAVITDFDGVHTDDHALVDADGHEFVRVSRSDGMGIARLRAAGIPVLIMSSETNPVVSARAAKLRVGVMQSVSDKASALREWAQRTGHDLSRVAYLGNDVNDLSAMRMVGWPVAVADAHDTVRAAARLVLTRTGGEGAVRELADRILP